MPGVSGVAPLQRLSQRVKQASARETVERAINRILERGNLDRADLDERFVPDFDLVDGRLSRELGDYLAKIRVDQSALQVELVWSTSAGHVLRSIPAAVKQQHGDELRALKQTVKEIQQELGTQRLRIERLLLNPRSWGVVEWRERYLDHPLLRAIARNLLWVIEEGEEKAIVGWHDDELVNFDDQPNRAITDRARVRLWHPIDSNASEVLAWREWLARHERRQPFKQAYREVYLLTDAERTTDTYSNRFAAHLLRQHQFASLAQLRGWSYRLQGAWDGHNTPLLDLPGWGVRAEFRVDGIGEDETMWTPAGIYLYASTDQVRFFRRGAFEPMSLLDVPPLVFTEVMRDVDLFVGVASVGNDPTWRDSGPAAYRHFWENYSFGALSATAETRRAVLERLLPRLTALAGRWSLDGRFLVVRGDMRTYRIHLGSGNILMEPNDEYLCIVPTRAKAADGSDHVFLPFDGDATLSLILSKALLLASDSAITDPTIVRQINRR
jgi:hypothetical protein